MKKTTEYLSITESHLLMPIIWEGDLNIHSNVPLMKNSLFQDIILHGDTVFSLAISLIEKQESTIIEIDEFEARYLKSLTVGDEIYSQYETVVEGEQVKLNFSVFNKKEELIIEGFVGYSSNP